MLRGTILAVAFMALLVAPARAQEATYAGQTPVTDPISVQAIVVATNFWRVRGLTACPDGIQTFMADSLVDGDDLYALGRGGDCQAWLARQPLHDERTYLDFPTYKDRRFEATDECREWTHEIGHALGLGHTPTGVMSPTNWDVPWDCIVWAKHLYPAPKPHHRHRRHRVHQSPA